MTVTTTTAAASREENDQAVMISRSQLAFDLFRQIYASVVSDGGNGVIDHSHLPTDHHRPLSSTGDGDEGRSQPQQKLPKEKNNLKAITADMADSMR